jgi:hypothetical protein
VEQLEQNYSVFGIPNWSRGQDDRGLFDVLQSATNNPLLSFLLLNPVLIGKLEDTLLVQTDRKH